jgi:D-beta-D-heptose 7-phosphate kinase/D-beta-D-heptose 1-phosphate adenosyltransferase
MEMVAALECVDAVVAFAEDTPLALIEEIVPAVLVKGGDYAVDQVVGREFVERHGGRIALVPFVSGYSTTELANRIARTAADS